jgi:hypothetical protein
MAINRKDKKVVSDLTIFEEQNKSKLSAKKVLKIAKEQEAEKIKQGHRYVASADGKTMWLTKLKK